MRFLILCLLLVHQATSTEIQQTLAKLEQSQIGLALLKMIQIRFRTGDPVDRVVQQIEQLHDSNEKELLDLGARQTEYDKECNTTILRLQDRISELDYKSKESFATLMNKKPHHQQTVQRFNYQKELLDDLRRDLQRNQELRDTQSDLYEYNVDMLERALYSMSEVRKLFVKYIQTQQHRRRIFGNGNAFLQEQGIDIEEALNDDFRDDVDSDDDLEERRLHYQRFVFVEIQVGIKKARSNLQGIVGVETLMQGFEELASILHEIHSQDGFKDGVSLAQTGGGLEEVSQLVVDICSRITDWIAQLRRWEDKTEDAKKHLFTKLQKLLKQQIADTQVDLDRLEGEARSLTLSVDNLSSTKSYSDQRLQGLNTELADKDKECKWQDFEFQNEIEKITTEQELVSELLQILVEKGGQLKRLMAEKIYG